MNYYSLQTSRNLLVAAICLTLGKVVILTVTILVAVTVFKKRKSLKQLTTKSIDFFKRENVGYHNRQKDKHITPSNTG